MTPEIRDRPTADAVTTEADIQLFIQVKKDSGILIPVFYRRNAFLFKEHPVKIGKRFKAACKGDGTHRSISFREQFTCMSNAHLIYIIRKCFARRPFHKLAKGTRRKMNMSSNFFKLQGFCQIIALY